VRAAWGVGRGVSVGLLSGCGEKTGGKIVREDRGITHLLLVVQALVVVLEHGLALYLAGVALRGGVCDVAGEDFLPEGEAAGGAWESVSGRLGLAVDSGGRYERERAGAASGRYEAERRRARWRVVGKLREVRAVVYRFVWITRWISGCFEASSSWSVPLSSYASFVASSSSPAIAAAPALAAPPRSPPGAIGVHGNTYRRPIRIQKPWSRI
jgi:hypothetical protein